ncbi:MULTISPECIES: hypothetical protein [unclassified Burkholderia]|uniref:hypothetical protein n=1 Tax=unclassified Burkholderia TaxID=2613784 RepID=UPI000AA68E2F|nr:MULTISPECIES: hypothetical protein [unclassified Burkholderia]
MATRNVLQPIPVIRDENGYFMHPDLRRFCNVTMSGAKQCGALEWAALEAQAGVKTSVYLLESEPQDHPAVDAYFVRGIREALRASGNRPACIAPVSAFYGIPIPSHRRKS